MTVLSNGEKPEKSVPAAPVHDESNWLVSYADMMTLLCGFFIMMFSMANLDEPKYERVRESIAKQFGGKFESPSKDLFDYTTNVIQDLGAANVVHVKTDPLGLSIVIESTVFFETLGTEVSSYGKSVLNQIIEKLREKQSKTKGMLRIVVEGHTDGRKILGGDYPSNWELSGARAARIVRMFVEHGFPPNQMTAIGYGDTRPLAVEKNLLGTLDEESLKKNRRVVIRILRPGVNSIPFAEDQPTVFPSPMVSVLPNALLQSLLPKLAPSVPSATSAP